MSNLFNSLHRQEAVEAGEVRNRQERFEHERVRWLLTRLGLARRINELRAEFRDRYGRPGTLLDFSLFNNVFPTFPFLLGSNILAGMPITRGGKTVTLPSSYAVYRDPESTEPARFRDFSNVPFVVAYSYFYRTVASDNETRKIGLVFPRKGFLHGMIIHNDESENCWRSGLCWVYKAVTDKQDRRLYVQPFAAVIDAIRKHGWRP